MSRRKLVIGVIAALIVGSAGAAIWLQWGRSAAAVSPLASASAERARGDKKPEPTLEFLTSEVVTPALLRIPDSIEFSGPLVAPQTAVLRAKAAGTLLTLAVAEGARVRAGQVLGQIDLADLTSRVAERNALLEQAHARLAQVERTHASNKRLAEQNFISPSALDASRADLDAAQAQWRAAQASLDNSKVGLREAALVAPISGLVQKRHAVPGEKVSLEQPVLTIVNLAQLELAGNVGTHEVSRLSPGMPVALRIEGNSGEVNARLARLAPAADTGTRLIGVTISLDNSAERFRAGQYASARVVIPDPVERLTLPSSAIVSTSGQANVWVVESAASGAQLVRRAVTLGRQDPATNRVEILQGVSAGAKILAARFDNLREGAKVEIRERAASAPSGASAAGSVIAASSAASTSK